MNRKILIVEDDPPVLDLFSRTLSASYEVVCASDGRRAKGLLSRDSFDAIVSDISMPGMDGIELLRAVREQDLDVPVILVTGAPDVETAMRAVEYGALRYLEKPVQPLVLREIVARAVQLHELARVKRQALSLLGDRAGEAWDRAGLESRFTRALNNLWMAFQPIVRFSTQKVYAYEALVRSRDTVFPHPGALLEAAERLGSVHQLGREIRNRVADAVPKLPGDEPLFVNLHPMELEDEELYSEAAPLSRHAGRVVLEITERARLEGIADLGPRLASLRSLGYRLAVDDLGSGYAGLTSFIQLNPEFVKIDMALVRDIDQHVAKQKLLESMLRVCREMGIRAVVEGVESPEEQTALIALGADLLQGYLFGAPAEGFVSVPADRISSGVGMAVRQ